MFNYQNNWDEIKSSSSYEAIKQFYEDALKLDANKDISSVIIRGYVDFHNESEIKSNIKKIERHLKIIDDKPRLGLQFEIIRKAPSLENTYFNKMVNGLKKEQKPELDDMFIFMMGHGFINHINEQNKGVLKDYIQKLKGRYQNLKGLDVNSVNGYFMKESTIDMKALEKQM